MPASWLLVLLCHKTKTLIARCPFLPPYRGKVRMGVEQWVDMLLPPPQPSPCKGEGVLCYGAIVNL